MRTKVMAGAAAGWAVSQVGVAWVLVYALGWSFQRALDSYVVSNSVIGIGFGVCGAVLAWHRPRHPLGWMFAAGGVLMTTTALAAPLGYVLRDGGAPAWLVRLDVTVFGYAWPWHIGLLLPLSLLLFPDGRVAGRGWRKLFVAVGVTAPLFVVSVGSMPHQLAGLPDGFFTLTHYDRLAALWNVSELRWSASMLLGLSCLAVRYRRGDEVTRRQLLWLLAAVAVVLVAVTPYALVAGTPILVLFSLPLIPAAIAVAVLRHQLLDIRLVLARGLGYALLSGLVLAGYALLIIVLSGVVSALVVALLALPLRARVQRSVDVLLYGERGDPLRVARRVGGQLDTGLEQTLTEVRTALRLPHVQVLVEGHVVAASGDPVLSTRTVPLGEGVELLVGLRTGESSLSTADARVLSLLAGPLAMAVRATRLSEALQASREQLVTTREEERRRLRRDLHDGLGPLLTGVALAGDAAANLAPRSPEQVPALLDSIRTDTRTAITEVRRIVDDLRPPALDELGLVAALEIRAAQSSRRSDGTPLRASVQAGPLPALPAAYEVAAYRVATEALTNVIRHSTASHVIVRLACTDALKVEVLDDGPDAGNWTAGVGMTAMRERAAELGGDCLIGPSPEGGRVLLSLPLVPT